MTNTGNVFRRIVLKLSGESFTHPGDRGISMDQVLKVCGQIVHAKSLGCQIAIVIGGGNILRGSQFIAASAGIKEVSAHYMGMLATVINGLALQEGLESLGVTVRLMSAIKMENVCEPYIVRRAVRHLEKDRVIVLAAGTGKPFVTTDTAAALYSLELDADVLMKATKVDGVYSHDPEKNPHAVLYRELTYDDFISQNLKVMDQTAITHCRDKSLPVLVFNFQKEGNIQRAVSGEKIGTLISSKTGAS
ncbi:MAG TPA: UMP kinase [Pirellulaceae bacterium]|mgnify:CR=1 FL=1|nr:UMP kinase [Pirellulaceae bacterium]